MVGILCEVATLCEMGMFIMWLYCDKVMCKPRFCLKAVDLTKMAVS